MAASVLTPIDPSRGDLCSPRAVRAVKLKLERSFSYPPDHAQPVWPSSFESPLAWSGSELRETDYTYVLTDDDKTEIEQALDHFTNLDLDVSEVGPSTFPLPRLQHRLQRLCTSLHAGLGFFVLRGLSPAYTPAEHSLIFMGVSSHVGARRGRQDDDGCMFMHIRNAVEMQAPQADRPARDSNTKLDFHSDMFCDILALQTRGVAHSGGNHIIASSSRIYNEIAKSRPDVLETLAKCNWTFDQRSLHAEPGRRSLLFNHDGRLILNFGRNRVLGVESERGTGASSRVTPQQLEALNLVQRTAENHQLELAMQPGDLAYINNWALLHARDAFEDTAEQTRYLVRMWLKNDEHAWKLPPILKRGNDKTYDGNADRIWNFLPGDRRYFKLREKFSP